MTIAHAGIMSGHQGVLSNAGTNYSQFLVAWYDGRCDSGFVIPAMSANGPLVKVEFRKCLWEAPCGLEGGVE